MNSRQRSLLRIHIVARRLNRSERTVRYWVQTGKLPACKIDKKSWGVSAEYFEIWLKLHGEEAHV